MATVQKYEFAMRGLLYCFYVRIFSKKALLYSASLAFEITSRENSP
jgi:hypothetical protein